MCVLATRSPVFLASEIGPAPQWLLRWTLSSRRCGPPIVRVRRRGLLTLRGAELLLTFEVLVHDRLIEAAVLDMAPADAERINVGKASQRINTLLVDRGRTWPLIFRSLIRRLSFAA